jgi:glycerol-3-phosphate acyltransferase PlsX
MGGDVVPSVPVAGAVLAARRGNVRVLLVGDAEPVQAELAKNDVAGLPIQVVPSEGVIREGEAPALALRSKPKASIAVATALVKAGKADAVVSMGSTGAAMAAAVFAFGLFPGLERPALGGPFIGLAPKVSIVDLGSQVDCKPIQMLSFGALGSTFSHVYSGVASPRVGLLSVGAEEGKGNAQVKEAFALFKRSGLNFVGNIEGHDIFADKADVVVCDGFVGNVLLKYTEGLAGAAAHYLAKELGSQSPAVQAIASLAAAAEQGGGPLFGVNGLSVIGHGRSKAEGVAGGIGVAVHCLEAKLIPTMKNDLATVMARSGAHA